MKHLDYIIYFIITLGINKLFLYFFQVQALLADKKVAEALELAKYSNKAGLSKEQFRNVSISPLFFILL